MASLFCPVCGTENPSTRLFCRKCASDLRAPVPDATAPVEVEPAPAVPLRPLAIGGGIALVAIILVIGLFVVMGGSPAASPSPQPTASPAATVAPTIAPTLTPTAAPTPTIAPTPASTPAASIPAGSGKPVVDSFSGPRSASCTDDNGTGTTGYIHLEWKASNTTGVRLSIDPPAPNDAYDYGYDDYAAAGEADVPFTCDPPNTDSGGAYHLYVATTIKVGSRFAYRYIKVYIKD